MRLDLSSLAAFWGSALLARFFAVSLHLSLQVLTLGGDPLARCHIRGMISLQGLLLRTWGIVMSPLGCLLDHWDFFMYSLLRVGLVSN